MDINSTNYVDCAESVIKELKAEGKGNIRLTTSKIRNILSMILEIYNEVLHESGEKLSLESQERIQYLKLRIIYESGREKEVKNFVKKSDLLSLLGKIKNRKDAFLLFSRYMEALVAYHRFYGGKDK